MPRTPAWLATAAAVVISGGAYYISTGLGEFWPAAWIAPIPVLVLAFGSTRRTAAVAAITAHFLGSLNLLAHFARLLPVVIVGLMVASRRARGLSGKWQRPLKRARMADPAMTPVGPPG